MGDVVLIENAREEREQELRQQRERIASTLEFMAAQARAGNVIGLCLAAIPSDRGSVTITAHKVDECGSHELVGAATILANYIANVVSQP